MYSFNTTYFTEKLTPPALRVVRILAFLRVITVPLQRKWDDFLEYINGSSYAVYSDVTSYIIGDRVKYGISIYECILGTTGNYPLNTLYWLLINKDFVGCDARIKFNSQKIIFEYVLNLYLNDTPTKLPLIYTTRNTIDVNGFYLGVDGISELGELGADSTQDDYLGTSYTLNQYSFTIYVPILLYTSLAATSADRLERVKNIADKYKLAGTTYDVITY